MVRDCAPSKPHRIAVIGLGRVGLVNAACWASLGHQVVGVDRSTRVVDAVNQATCPFYDPTLEMLLQQTVPQGGLRAVGCVEDAVRGADILVCCVGTPAGQDGVIDLEPLRRAYQQIGGALSVAARNPIIVLRSTVPPNTTSAVLISILEDRSGLQNCFDFEVAVVPEFLREGSAVEDFMNATRAIIGINNPQTFERLKGLLASTSQHVVMSSLEMAELCKLTDNAWHSLKVAFANELGNVAVAHSLDGRQLLELLCRDDKLNMSAAYLRPGFAFGGPCLPKDLNMLRQAAAECGVATPVLSGIDAGNREQIERARRFVQATGTDRVGLIGAQFKPGTQRYCGSPQLKLLAALESDGISGLVYAPVRVAPIAISAECHSRSGQKGQMMRRISNCVAETINFSDVIIVAELADIELQQINRSLHEKTILDLAGIPELRALAGTYIGVN